MRVGIPTEVKNNEERVAITPHGVNELVAAGHDVLIQSGAGIGSSITDDDFTQVGAQILSTANAVWESAEMILKVKEPIAEEYHHLREDLVLFTYLHLAADEACTRALLDAGTTAIAYETVRLPSGQLPLLHPMSEVAGCLAPQIGANYLQSARGGRGVLMGGVGGVAPAKVLIIGAGVAGQSAAQIAIGMGAEVTVLDTDLNKLREISTRWENRVTGLHSSKLTIQDLIRHADLVIGAVLIPGAKSPTLVSNEMVATMKPGSVLVDIAIDQGGCFEDSRPTTHADPIYRVHDSTFYCVGNMPGAVPHTSTYALTNATMPYAVRLADLGWRAALTADPALADGLNTHEGRVTHPGVAEAFGMDWTAPSEILG